MYTLSSNSRPHKTPSFFQHAQTSNHPRLHTSCNLHFSILPVRFPLRTWPDREISVRQSSLQSRFCVYFGRQVFAPRSPCRSSHGRANWVLFSVTPFKQRDPLKWCGLPVVVTISDGCLMETSVPARQHEKRRRGALSQHRYIFIFP